LPCLPCLFLFAEEFYVPGCTHRSWNKVPPVLRIMMRVEVRDAGAEI
jgi:hypothetical protein